MKQFRRLGSLILTFGWLYSSSVFAVNIFVHNPCSDQPWLNAETPFIPNTSLGKVTIETLSLRQIPFVGNEVGINSINGTVTGERSMEIINDHEFRAYGWCFHLNGREPAETADHVIIQSDQDQITWFFAYARYLNGAWTEMCVPTHISRPSYICK